MSNTRATCTPHVHYMYMYLRMHVRMFTMYVGIAILIHVRVCVCAAKTKALFTAACVRVCEQQRSMDRYMIAMDTTIRGTTRWGQVCI